MERDDDLMRILQSVTFAEGKTYYEHVHDLLAGCPKGYRLAVGQAELQEDGTLACPAWYEPVPGWVDLSVVVTSGAPSEEE